jgi:predicted dehydrogenase
MRSRAEADSVSIAIVGCGQFGVELGAWIREVPTLRVVAVCDPEPRRAAALAEAFEADSFESFDDLLRRSSADAVALVTPNDLHCEQAIAAAASGKHVFCEKPMALTVADCLAMIDAAEAADVRLMVGHKRRLRPAYVLMADTVAGGTLGRLLTAAVDGFHDRPPSGWWAQRRRGGGLLNYAGIHDIDFLLHIGGGVEQVHAVAPSKVDDRTDILEAITVVLRFSSSATASLNVSWKFPGVPFQQSFAVRLVLEHGGIFYDPVGHCVEIRAVDEQPRRLEFDRAAGFGVAYRRELASFANWILHGEEPVLTAWDGLRCVEVVEAAQRSLDAGTAVALPLEPTVMEWSPPRSEVATR